MMAGSRSRILCVDDDADTCEMLSFFLDRAGYEVVAAKSFGDGLKLALQGNFDLYLLDLRLPDGNGIELCRQIREFDSGTPVLVCSGDVRESIRSQAFEAGVQHFLKKPLALTNLAEIVARLMNAKAGLNGSHLRFINQ
jgi:DNA-binding response OmpR family regulator